MGLATALVVLMSLAGAFVPGPKAPCPERRPRRYTGSYRGREAPLSHFRKQGMATIAAPPRRRETLESAVIRFAGDSGDGMQITGSQFTNTTALFGNDLATFPDYPAEIRAPAGTLPG